MDPHQIITSRSTPLVSRNCRMSSISISALSILEPASLTFGPFMRRT